MRKHLVTVLAVASIFCAAPMLRAVAQGPHGHFSAEDESAFTDAKIAELKAGLRLTTEQEKHWPALEAAIRDTSKARMGRMQEMRASAEARRDHPDAVAAMRQRAQMMKANAADLDKLADASAPLYGSLDDAQKRRFAKMATMAALMHMEHAEHMMHEQEHEHGHHDE